VFQAVSDDVNCLAAATIGAALAVHRQLGPGFLESIYSQALRIELEARGLPFESEKAIDVLYRGCRFEARESTSSWVNWWSWK